MLVVKVLGSDYANCKKVEAEVKTWLTAARQTA